MSEVALFVVDGDSVLVNVLLRALKENDYRILASTDDAAAQALSLMEKGGLRPRDTASLNGDSLRFLREFLEQHHCAQVILVEVARGSAGASGNGRQPPTSGQRTNGNGAAPASDWPSEILGGACMEGIREQVLRAARSNLPVLLTGETGTGKDLVARAIHRLSDRCKQPLIKHNCATSLPQLLEGQFFGSCEGSFTGATQDRRGLLDLAHGGVLFLDELETMDPILQAKLLCAIEDQEIWPVGASRPTKVSVRFLAATNRDPRRMMAQGTLREDLYYRLRKIQIHLKPLREHREDIPLLVEHFLGPQASMLTPEAMGKLMAEEWPGNVRQLQSVLLAARDAVLASGHDCIAAEHLDLTPPVFESPGVSVERGCFGKGMTLAEGERDMIIQAIQSSGGNKAAAARVLGIERKTLWAKLRRHGLEAGARPVGTPQSPEACRIDAPSVSNRHASRKLNGAG